MSQAVTPLPGHAGVPDVAGDHLNALRFLDEHGAGLRRSPELGRWYLWNGGWWEEDRLERVQAMARTTVDNLRKWVAEARDPNEFKQRSAHYQASAKAGRRDALLQIAGTDREIVVAVDQLDVHPMLLACQNGTVDLSTGELRTSEPSDLLTRGIAVDYDPDAYSESWIRVPRRDLPRRLRASGLRATALGLLPDGRRRRARRPGAHRQRSERQVDTARHRPGPTRRARHQPRPRVWSS